MDFDDDYFCMMQSKSLKILHHIKVQINISLCQKEYGDFFIENNTHSCIETTSQNDGQQSIFLPDQYPRKEIL
jgi:hypothetical protein